MNLSYTLHALKQIDEAISYIEQRSPTGANNVAARFHEVISFLLEQPMAGIATSEKHVRRFAATPYPYCIFYRATKTELVIIRVRHTSRRSKP